MFYAQSTVTVISGRARAGLGVSGVWPCWGRKPTVVRSDHIVRSNKDYPCFWPSLFVVVSCFLVLWFWSRAHTHTHTHTRTRTHTDAYKQAHTYTNDTHGFVIPASTTRTSYLSQCACVHDGTATETTYIIALYIWLNCVYIVNETQPWKPWTSITSLHTRLNWHSSWSLPIIGGRTETAVVNNLTRVKFAAG